MAGGAKPPAETIFIQDIGKRFPCSLSHSIELDCKSSMVALMKPLLFSMDFAQRDAAYKVGKLNDVVLI